MRIRLERTLALLVLLCLPASADSWLPPTTRTYFSPDQQWRLTVTPRAISSQLAYFEDKVKDKAQAGAPPGNVQKQAQGFMEHLEQGEWRPVWSEPLVNDVAPVEAVVSDNGRAATFDNWHSMGWGSNVVVLYDDHGHQIRNLGLMDFLSKQYVSTLPHSVSSIQWGRGHHFSADGSQLILRVVVPNDPTTDPLPTKYEYVEIALDAHTGQLIEPRGKAWERAQQIAIKADAILSKAEALAEQQFVSPLARPDGDATREWFRYLREAFWRLDPQWDDNFPRMVVLNDGDSKVYQVNLRTLREELAKPEPEDGVLMIGSSDPSHLVKVIAAEMPKAKPGSMKTYRIYVTVTPATTAAAKKVISSTGATFIPLDITQAIPQRAERLKQHQDSRSDAEND